MTGNDLDVAESRDGTVVVAVRGTVVATPLHGLRGGQAPWECPSHSGAGMVLHRYAACGAAGVETMAGRFGYVIVDRAQYTVWLGTDLDRHYPWYWERGASRHHVSATADAISRTRLAAASQREWMAFIEQGVRPAGTAHRTVVQVPGGEAVGFRNHHGDLIPMTPAPAAPPLDGRGRIPIAAVDRAEQALLQHLQGLAQLGPWHGGYVDGGSQSLLAITLAVRAGIGQPPLYFPGGSDAQITRRIRGLAKYLGLSALELRPPEFTPQAIARLVRRWPDPWVTGASYELYSLWMDESAGWYLTGFDRGHSTLALRRPGPPALWDLFGTCGKAKQLSRRVLGEVARRWVPRAFLGPAHPAHWPLLPWSASHWMDRGALAVARAAEHWGLDAGTRCRRWLREAHQGDRVASARMFRLLVVDEWVSQERLASPQQDGSALSWEVSRHDG